MNNLNGVINLTQMPGDAVQSSISFDNKLVALEVTRTNIFTYDSENLFYDAENKALFVVIGYFNNLIRIKEKYKIKEESDVKILSHLYKSGGYNAFDELEGVFLILVYATDLQKIWIYQSKFGYSLPFYYFTEGEQVFFGTSLKKLLPNKKIRDLNINSAVDFIFYQQIVPHEHTLIKGISKLVPNQILEFDLHKRKTYRLSYHRDSEKVNFEKAKKTFMGTIENSLKGIADHLKDDAALTHTGGWDSNLMLHHLRRFNPTGNINTFTISGGEIYDEVNVVKEIHKKFYKNIQHYTSNVSTDINSLVDMVWIYEGYIFQEGMFLRHELAKLLHKNTIHSIILGATADQMLFPPNRLKQITRNFRENKFVASLKYLKGIITGKKRNTRVVHRKSLKRAIKNKAFYNIQVDMLLKMHDIMLNHFGVTSLFPYLSESTAAACRALRKINKNKRFYKQQVRNIIGDEITSYLAKSHSLVDTRKIFDANKDLLLRIFTDKKQFILQFIDISTYKKLIKYPSENHLVVLHCIYLFLFNEQFISGKFDKQFSELLLKQKLQEFVAN